MQNALYNIAYWAYYAWFTLFFNKVQLYFTAQKGVGTGAKSDALFDVLDGGSSYKVK